MRLVDNVDSAVPQLCNAVPRHAVLVVREVEDLSVTFVGELQMVTDDEPGSKLKERNAMKFARKAERGFLRLAGKRNEEQTDALLAEMSKQMERVFKAAA